MGHAKAKHDRGDCIMAHETAQIGSLEHANKNSVRGLGVGADHGRMGGKCMHAVL
jgi:hypothetical protein